MISIIKNSIIIGNKSFVEACSPNWRTSLFFISLARVTSDVRSSLSSLVPFFMFCSKSEEKRI